MSIISGSIQYVLTGSVSLHSFPFIDPDATATGELFTPSTLNIALGGSEGTESSSLIESILGEGVAASYLPNVGWQGSLTTISPKYGYWLKPASGSTFNSSATLSGVLRSSNKKYNLHTGNNLISYPFNEDKPFSEAVDDTTGNGTSLQDLGIESIIGQGVAAQFNSASDAWVGSLVSQGFKSGSAYWIRSENSGHFQIWKGPPGHSLIECNRQINQHGHFRGVYGQSCYNKNNLTGWQEIAEYPYSQSGHTFGNYTSGESWYPIWSGNIGKGPDGSLTSSLFDSASNDMSGSNDGTSDFIIGFFKSSSTAEPHPCCCGALVWHDHEKAPSSMWEGQDKMAYSIINGHSWGSENNWGGLAYPDAGDEIEVKVFDPRRNIVVSASIHEVDITNGTASIGSETTLNFPTADPAGITLFVTHSAELSNEYILSTGGSGRCFKMKT